MINKKSKVISLSGLAKELEINKSKLLYYTSKGLLEPLFVIGKTMVFMEDEAVKRILTIGRLKKAGFSLKQIKEKLDK